MQPCSRSNEYLRLISTDISLDKNEIIWIYGKRWDIEVFFNALPVMLKTQLQAAKKLDIDNRIAAVDFCRSLCPVYARMVFATCYVILYVIELTAEIVC